MPTRSATVRAVASWSPVSITILSIPSSRKAETTCRASGRSRSETASTPITSPSVPTQIGEQPDSESLVSWICQGPIASPNSSGRPIWYSELSSRARAPRPARDSNSLIWYAPVIPASSAARRIAVAIGCSDRSSSDEAMANSSARRASVAGSAMTSTTAN